MSEALFHPGDRIGGFTVLHPCGEGAFGQVYLVRDAEGRVRALKVLSADKRGERELDGLLRFRKATHPNLLRIDRLSTLPDGRVFYTMDAADNAVTEPDYAPDTLARRMRERGALPPEELKHIMLELADAVTELHRAHLVHRDIKPENILFVNGRATLADAGAVGEFDGKTFIGTPEYLPPDVCLGKRAFTAADDCHALGMVLYSALTGEAPRQFPSTPRTLVSPEEVALFKAAERACTPPGVSAYRFRELLEHPEKPSTRRFRRTSFILTALAVCLVVIGGAAALLLRKRTPQVVEPVAKTAADAPVVEPVAKTAADTPVVEPPAAEPQPDKADAPPQATPTAEPTAAERQRASLAYTKAFVQKMKADEARLRAEQEQMRSSTVQPIGMKRRDAVNSAEPTAAELLEKHHLSTEDRKLVDRWLAVCVDFDRRINAAYMARNDALVAKLMKEKKARLPYGIDDFCGDEMRSRKYLSILTREYTPAKRRQLELALLERRDRLKRLLDKLPPNELAKWR